MESQRCEGRVAAPRRAFEVVPAAWLLVAPMFACCNSVYVALAGNDAELETGQGEASLGGVSVAAEAWEDGAQVIGFTELRVWRDSEVGIDVVELDVGGRFPLVADAGYALGVQADVGVAQADVDGFRNRNDLLSVSCGLFGRTRLVDRLWLAGSVGVRQYWDVTEPTTCRDGTTSTSTGSGTCSYHGGIAHYNDQLGDAVAAEFSIGLVLRF